MIIDCFFYIKYCHCIIPTKLCLRVDLRLILWFHIHEGSVNISSVAFNVHLQYLTLNNKISWFVLNNNRVRSPDKYCSCFTWILVLIEPLHIFSVTSRKLQIILSVLKNVFFKRLKISNLKAKRKIFFLVKESGDSNYTVTKKSYVQIINNYYWMRLSKVSWFVSGERDADKSQYFVITEVSNCLIIRSPSLFFKGISSGSKAICHFHTRAIARWRETWFHLCIHEPNIFCSQTKLDDIVHEQTIFCRQLFVGHMVGSRQWKGRKICNKWLFNFLACVQMSPFPTAIKLKGNTTQLNISTVAT